MRARYGMLLLVLAVVGLSCTGDEPAPTGCLIRTDRSAELISEPRGVAARGRMEARHEVSRARAAARGERPGFQAPQAIEGNGWVDGTLEQLARKDDPCEGAVPREHSHFFTEFGTFGSLDWRGEQVDEGTYEIVDDRTFTIGDATFHFDIQGDTIRFEPVLPDTCTGFDCVWMLAVASPGYDWERVSL